MIKKLTCGFSFIIDIIKHLLDLLCQLIIVNTEINAQLL